MSFFGVPKVFTSGMSIISRTSGILSALGMDPESGFRAWANQKISVRRGTNQALSTAPRLSYSQLGEDAVLQSFLPPGQGFYVDIGSGHPVEGSNTYALYLKGWRGVLVDPIRSNIELSRRVRPGDQCIPALCTSVSGESHMFFEFETYQYSTLSVERASEVEALGHPLKDLYELQALSMQDLLPHLLPSGPMVWSIDVEGAEMAVPTGNSWDRFLPDLICIEEWQSPLLAPTEVSQYLAGKGYELVAVCGVSSIYRLAVQPMETVTAFEATLNSD
jgi:hypothetical protein